MKKILLLTGALVIASAGLMAQYEKEGEEGFQGHFFTGGSISLGIAGNYFLVGANPVFGYTPLRFVDVGLVINYNYASYRDVNYGGDKLHQSTYGGGFFTKLYPVKFLFVQAQVEHNYVNQKYFPPAGYGSTQTDKVDANSFLIGGGYTSGRDPDARTPFFYLAILFDVADNTYSPYTDGYGRVLPIIRAGLQIPLGKKK